MVNPEGQPCPTGDGGHLTHPGGGLGNFIASVLTGEAFTATAKALAAAGTGARGSWMWLTCPVCHLAYVGCQNCGNAWHANESPRLGDEVTCPRCGERLI
jgi:DNA-directed RNA polymerase subunit RPC12/RpoP